MRRYADVFSRIPAERLSHLIDSYIRRDDYKDITRDRLLRCLTYEQIAEPQILAMEDAATIIRNRVRLTQEAFEERARMYDRKYK